jgi:5,10-methylenetetrahydromethanopterin reductase
MIPIGVMLTPVTPLPRVVELARLAEQLGYSRIWVPDEGLATRDVFVTMTAIAAATQTVMVGTGITNPYTRHPALVAGAIASIDEVSGGRAFLGYGAGGSLALKPLGIDRVRPLVRVREAIEVARRLFDGQTIDEDAGSIRLTGARLCVGRPDIEIWFAGRGSRMLHQAGALTDGVLFEFLHKPTLGQYVERVREGAATTGNQPILCYSTTIVTDAARLDEIRPHMTYRIVDSPPSVKAEMGVTDADIAAITDAMGEDLGAAAALIPDEWIEPFVLAGSGERCADELEAIMTTHGFDEFMLVVADMDDAEELMRDVADIVSRIPSRGGARMIAPADRGGAGSTSRGPVRR